MKTFFLIAALMASATAIRALPVQTNPGSQATLTAQTTSKHGKLYIAGTIAGLQSANRHTASNVEVDLVNAQGRFRMKYFKSINNDPSLIEEIVL